MTAAALVQPPLRARVTALVESAAFTRLIVALILVNTLTLGLETFPGVMAAHGKLLVAVDRAILAVFVAELGLRLYAYRGRFFRDPWSLFDTAVVAVALLPANEAFSVLRAMRVLRVLRLVSVFPRLRRVIEGLLAAIPSLGSIAAILVIVLYVFAVMGAKLFGADHPQWFGGLHTSLFTLFQIMTLEGWADIVREIKVTHPYAWVFFIVYILLSTFTVLNFFIAVIVDAMQKSHAGDEDRLQAGLAAIARDVEAVRLRIETLAASDRRH